MLAVLPPPLPLSSSPLKSPGFFRIPGFFFSTIYTLYNIPLFNVCEDSFGHFYAVYFFHAAERMVAIGLAMPFPAMSGAEPWMGS